MFTLKTTYKKLLADTFTPVSLYLRIRDRFPNSLLLESSDYHGTENSFSYICCNPIASVKVEKEILSETFPDGSQKQTPITPEVKLPEAIQEFSRKFRTTGPDFGFINQGLFGFIAYDGVRYFEEIVLSKKSGDLDLPELYYAVYQNIIAINHFNNEAYIFDHSFNSGNRLEEIEQLLRLKNFASYPFSLQGEQESNESDESYRQIVAKAREHCHRGDVFQMVLSRRFSQGFRGDEFNVYRALRNINPSPYLFFFDYGSFKIFGSSPEAQLVVKNENAEIHPISGTFRRTGNDAQDAENAERLAADDKENSEHVMLVDLARNDLSRHGSQVRIETYKEIQYFSHVIHLVSKVSAVKDGDTDTMRIVADTFPAGTLSGAPKFRAMELIEQYENVNRDFYGGAIGFMDFSGNFNHAIIIRSFLSKNHRLHYQAGAGIVADSTEENELQEVYNKTRALQQAMLLAEDI